MTETLERKDAYLASFSQREKNLNGNAKTWLPQVRKNAIARFDAMGFPTTDHEDWRFTSIAPIAKVPFKLAPAIGLKKFDAEKLWPFTFGAADGLRLVFVNGHFAPELSIIRSLPEGVVVKNLSAAVQSRSAGLEEHLAKVARLEENSFVALNTAFIEDGAFIHLPKGQAIEEPIHLLYLSVPSGEAQVAYPRTLIVAEAGSQAAVIESYAGLGVGNYFTNAVTEVVLRDHARLDHCRVQREAIEAFHVSTTQIYQEKASHFASHAIAMGGALVRNDVNALLDAEGCECTLNGLSMASGRQLVDNHTAIDHARPRCASHELYRTVLDGKARGVFNGKIFVRKDAQKTDAKQTNQTLLLSEEAVIDTKPQLEIFADDVKCTHGATVGHLDEEAMFYLCSRGLGREQAKSLLTYAFANKIVNEIKFEPLRRQLESVLLTSQHLPEGEKVQGV